MDEILAQRIDGALAELIRLVREGSYPPDFLRARIAELNAAVAATARYQPPAVG